MPYLGEGTIVPQVALVGEAVADEAKLALLDVLLDGVQELILGDLVAGNVSHGQFSSTAQPRSKTSRANGEHPHLPRA
jgi:hypothetical protein